MHLVKITVGIYIVIDVFGIKDIHESFVLALLSSLAITSLYILGKKPL